MLPKSNGELFHAMTFRDALLNGEPNKADTLAMIDAGHVWLKHNEPAKPKNRAPGSEIRRACTATEKEIKRLRNEMTQLTNAMMRF